MCLGHAAGREVGAALGPAGCLHGQKFCVVAKLNPMELTEHVAEQLLPICGLQQLPPALPQHQLLREMGKKRDFH